MVQIKWTFIALDDLKEIHNYIARDSPKFARLQVIKIKSRTAILRTHITAGKVVPEFAANELRELVEGNFRIIYKIVNEKRVDILTIHHGARDLNRREIK